MSLQPVRANEHILDEFERRIRISISYGYTTLDQLTQLGDRAFGKEPETGSTDDKLPVSPQGAVDRVLCALTDLDNMLCRLEHAGNRLHELA